MLNKSRRAFLPRCGSLEDRRLLSVTLSSGSRPGAAIVGAPVLWTAQTGDHGDAPVYQFRVTPVGGETQIVRDFSAGNTLAWAPPQEGRYVVSVVVKDTYNTPASTAEIASVLQTVRPRVGNFGAAVSRTANPLVALYSAAPTSTTSLYVQYRPQGSAEPWSETAPQTVTPGKTTNFLVAELRPNTTYLMRHVRGDGAVSAIRAFRTTALPPRLNFPSFDVIQSPAGDTDPTLDTIYHIGIYPPKGTINTVATDLAGNVVWYYDSIAGGFPSYSPSLTPDGTVLLIGGVEGTEAAAVSLREVDLAGNILRETNANALNAQLADRGFPAILDVHHDALRLHDGRTAVIAKTQKTIDVNGTPTQYVGDAVLVLDQNFQVVWTWNSFDSLDPNVLSPLEEGAHDWTHSNSVAWSPADGNLIVSVRSLDWVIKINYDDGRGDGALLWKLGRNGDFQINSDDPSPWFTHQHDARYVNDSMLLVYDNGNTRVTLDDPQGNSRGQLYHLDEQSMQATLVVNADLGEYAFAVGSAQRLPDGTFSFNSGFTRKTINVRADGSPTFIQKMNTQGIQYRSYVYSSLYGNPADLLDPGFEDPPQGTGATAHQINPSGSAWTFNGPAGVVGNGGLLTGGRPNAPQGSQVALLQESGSISQVIRFHNAGTYRVSLSASQWGDPGATSGMLVVQIDGETVGTITPDSTGYTSYTTTGFDVSAGDHTLSFTAVDPTGDDFTALLDRVQIENVAATEANARFVDLSPAFNRNGIVADGTPFTGGLDGLGNALSSRWLGTQVVAGGNGFKLGAANSPNVVSASGQVIALPGGRHRALNLLATAVNGSQDNQTFVVTYTDGTTATLRQSLTDWNAETQLPRGSAAITGDYRNTADGGRQPGASQVRVYTLPLNPTKTVRSLTLPDNLDVEILAATLVPAGRFGWR